MRDPTLSPQLGSVGSRKELDPTYKLLALRLPMRPGAGMVLLAAQRIARLAPELTDQSPDRRVDADLLREVRGDLHVLRQQSQRKAGAEDAAQHMLLDEALAHEAASGRGVDDVG